MNENTLHQIIKQSRELHKLLITTTSRFQHNDIQAFLQDLAQASLEAFLTKHLQESGGLAPNSFRMLMPTNINCDNKLAILQYLRTSEEPAFKAFCEKIQALDIDAAFMVTHGPTGYILRVVFLFDQPFRGRPAVFYGYC